MSDLSEEMIHIEVVDTDDRFNHVFLIRTQVFCGRRVGGPG